MFNRIRYAAHVLSSTPVNPYERLDIAFEEEKPVEVTGASRIIGGLIEIVVVSILIGTISVHFLGHLWPVRTVAHVNEATAIIAAILGMLAIHFFEQFKAELGRRLRIRDKVAPYFGHRITHAIRILRS